MARKGWGALSPTYKTRLEKAGMTRADYEAGGSLQKARGHATTPENPRAYSPTKYPKYHATRTQLITQLEARKQQIFGSRPRWDSQASRDNIRNYPPTVSQLRWANSLDDEEFEDALDQASDDEYAWFGYH
jgi:hypothetical protein